VANVKGLDSGRKKQIKKHICLQYSVIVIIGGNELSSSILSEKPTSHSTYPTLPCSVLLLSPHGKGKKRTSFSSVRVRAMAQSIMILKVFLIQEY